MTVYGTKYNLPQKLGALFPRPEAQEVIQAIFKQYPTNLASWARVDYKILEQDKVLKEVKQEICFARLHDHIKSCSSPKTPALTFLYDMGTNPSDSAVQVKERQELAHAWVRLGQEYNLLDPHQAPEQVVAEGYRIQVVDPKLSPRVLYARLCYLRYTIEFPNLCGFVLKCVQHLGASLWAALAFAHKLRLGGYGGHTIMLENFYYTTSALPGVESEVRPDIGRYRQVYRESYGETTSDKRNYFETVHNSSYSFPWEWDVTIKKLTQGKQQVLADNILLLTPEAGQFISGDDTQAAAALTKLQSYSKDLTNG